MTPSERLHRIHERCAKRVTVEPYTPSIVPAMQGVLNDLVTAVTICAFIGAMAGLLIGIGG